MAAPPGLLRIFGSLGDRPTRPSDALKHLPSAATNSQAHARHYLLTAQ